MAGIYVDVLTPDQRFGRMIALEAERIGADVCLGEYRSQMVSDDVKHFVIADLDAYSDGELEKFGSGSTLIGFSTGYEQEMPARVKVCNGFLHRPFLVSELLAIIVGEAVSDAAQAQSKSHVSSAHKTKNNVLRVNPERRCAVWGNEEIPLSDNEYRVLELLCAKRGIAVLRDEIDSVLSVDGGNMSDVYICHLRRKLDNKLGLKLICTVRGKGYTLNN